MTDEKRVSELLPCPFCGGKASVRHERDLYLDRYQRHFVKCGSCGASGSEKIANEDDAYGAIQSVLAGWNRRSQEPDGWRLVPVEPTEAMVRAMGDAFLDAAIGHEAGDLANVNAPFRRFYRAMLAAAPQSTEGK
jgi:Lar family restriction alleviation protein